MTEVKYQGRAYTNMWVESVLRHEEAVRYTFQEDTLAKFWETTRSFTLYDQERYEQAGRVTKVEMERLENGLIVSRNELTPFDHGEGESWVQQGWVDELLMEKKPFVPMTSGDRPISEDDEGELQIAMAVVPESKVVVVNFGKAVRWVGFSAETLNIFVKALQEKAQELRDLVKV